MSGHYQINSNFEIVKGDCQKTKKNHVSKLRLANYLGIGYYLVTPVVLGLFAGLLAKKTLKMGNIFFIICFLTGIAGSFYNLYKIYIDERTPSV